MLSKVSDFVAATLRLRNLRKLIVTTQVQSSGLPVGRQGFKVQGLK